MSCAELASCSLKRLRARNRGQLEHRAHLRRFEDMSEVADQAVGNVDRGRSKTAQCDAESDPRGGPQERVLTRGGFVGGKSKATGVMRERQRRIAKCAGYPDGIASACAATKERFPAGTSPIS